MLAVLDISAGVDAAPKELDGNNPSSIRPTNVEWGIHPGHDRGWSFESSSLDEGDRGVSVEPLPAQALPELRINMVETPAQRVLPLSGPDMVGISGIACQPIFTWDCGWALATIYCESTNNPNAQGTEWYQGKLYHFNGWWQITEGPFDPYLNTVEAHIQYVQWMKGIRADPWPNC